MWTYTQSSNLADRDASNHRVLAERAAAHEMKQCFPIASETTRAIRHEALTLCYSVQ